MDTFPVGATNGGRSVSATSVRSSAAWCAGIRFIKSRLERVAHEWLALADQVELFHRRYGKRDSTEAIPHPSQIVRQQQAPPKKDDDKQKIELPFGCLVCLHWVETQRAITSRGVSIWRSAPRLGGRPGVFSVMRIHSRAAFHWKMLFPSSAKFPGVTAIEQPLTESDAVGAGAIGEEAIVANTMRLLSSRDRPSFVAVGAAFRGLQRACGGKHPLAQTLEVTPPGLAGSSLGGAPA
jgi:hypothetical protein